MSSGVPVLEIGGSHVTAAMVSAGLVERVHRAGLDSKASAESIVGELCDAARQLPLASGLAVALPGPFDFAAGVAWYKLDKFAALYGQDLGRSLRERLGLERIVFMNDAEAFTIGEWFAGELRGLDRCVGITIGTGIGSAFLDDGRAIRTGDTVPPGGELYRTSFDGRPIEDCISARAILRRYADKLGTPPPRSTGVKEIAEAARAGDAVAESALVEAFQVLADALAPWLARFGATRVVLGGSIAGAFDVVAEVFPFPVSATADAEHSALIGAALHFERSTGPG
ncbi:ROK family protein [Streptomyces sp. SID13031]|uniref:ROK family protein n=1 Tax=Streptomyces sp. SID13031 TaxID=2706046 RepID=UPI0013CD83EC|nr:ROK family protein [Streptomyces sp. SID13031]NEA37491.1 ROK family protein [Streptomyces sp. SID13031]